MRAYAQNATAAGLDPVARQAWQWFVTEVPQRSLHNWQNAAARLIAADLRGNLVTAHTTEITALTCGWQWLAASGVDLAVASCAISVVMTAYHRSPDAPRVAAGQLRDSLLRFALRADATLCAGLGLLVAMAADPLSRLSGLSATSEWIGGAALVVYGALLYVLAGVARCPRVGIGVLAGNVVFADPRRRRPGRGLAAADRARRRHDDRVHGRHARPSPTPSTSECAVWRDSP